MAASTLSRVALLTLGWLLITRDTVWWETPARSATSSSRGSRALLFVMGLLCAIAPPNSECRPATAIRGARVTGVGGRAKRGAPLGWRRSGDTGGPHTHQQLARRDAHCT